MLHIDVSDDVACITGRWNSPSVTQTHKQNQKMTFYSTTWRVALKLSWPCTKAKTGAEE